jgi:hypothetical protein
LQDLYKILAGDFEKNAQESWQESYKILGKILQELYQDSWQVLARFCKYCKILQEFTIHASFWQESWQDF